ncbi:type I-D CRISPR-associated protein Cas10d/Csc3 [Thermus scotoductus]|uniref:Type I-D CRISPR-associated protein Cas10d/Csc3 n=1 Tax=Thermus scotoductus TaxID=37636 RepID=A0A430UYW7_THESC|nr:type I-D CRISPR-associated protein Cas10d/Csc3 [Thermus scotoductus]RTH98276.1 type I-D CRISPR-associated protein Cas10d/Csc3 [Thermus scotoductus]RTI14726.1 type I-D CRISPR-associated protein Cas10d/Csc3 [Thermus scotoductus]
MSEDLWELLDAKGPELERRHPLTHLALEVWTQPEDSVLREWARHVLPNLLAWFSLRPAKGLSRKTALELIGDGRAPELREQALNKLVRMGDQSLATHTLNALAAGWTWVKLAGLDKQAQRLYLAGVTLHDLNKMDPALSGKRLDGPEGEHYRSSLHRWGEVLGVWRFVGEEYLDDVAFLAQNAEDVRGENRTLSNYVHLRLPPDLLEDLAEFVRVADLAASVAQRPQDLPRHKKINNLLRRLLRGRYVLRYHRTREHRGLLTQVIHNGVIEAARKAGWIPWLFFPDGVTYLVPKEAPELDVTGMPQWVRQEVLRSVKPGISELIFRDGKGIRFKPELIEVADVGVAGATLIRRVFTIIHEDKLPRAAERRAKILTKFPELQRLDWDIPNTLQVDRLAEGLSGLAKLLEAYYAKPVEEVAHALLEGLGVGGLYEEWKQIPPDGGVPFNWYYVAGQYLKHHPGLDEADLEGVMQHAFDHAVKAWGAPQTPPPFAFLEDYVAQVLDLGTPGVPWKFEQAWHRYVRNKAHRGRTPVCAVCHSPFDVQEEFSNYSNKRETSLKKGSERGICAVCRVERLLRQYTMGGGLGDDGVYLHLYPSYFFTPETALVMDQAYRNFAQTTFPELDKQLAPYRYHPRAVATADVFMIEVPSKNPRLDKVVYPQGQIQGYYLLRVPPMVKKPTETEIWAMPLLLGVLAPVVLGVKAVVSTSGIPLFDTGAAFPESVVIDGGPAFWQQGMRTNRFRLDELTTVIPAVFTLYGLTYQAYHDSKGAPSWNQLNTVARHLATTPLYVFHYQDRIQRQRGMEDLSPRLAEQMLLYYWSWQRYIGGDNPMGMIQELVDRYARFYRGEGRAAYARLRPLDAAARVVINSAPETDKETLQLMIEGELHRLLESVLDRQAKGFIPEEGRRLEARKALVEEFARYFLDKVFYSYCKGDRARLRQHLNLIRHAAEAYYLKAYRKAREEALERSDA